MKKTEIIQLSKFGNSMGTREFGRELREKSLELIKNGAGIIFDFSSINIISSAFADELFGKLFLELGEEAFKNNIRINKFDNEETRNLIILIINKAVDFRKNSPSINKP